MTFHQFLVEVDQTFYIHKDELRYGQTVMNTLYDTWKEKYDDLMQRNLSCFYDEKKVPEVLRTLEKEWIDE